MENLFSFLKGGLNQQNRVLFFLNLFIFNFLNLCYKIT